nr:MAG TPA: hypothetical protein [Caudoviricetes sp.]
MNMKMTLSDEKVILGFLLLISLIWAGYNSEHSDNEKLQTVTSFWLGSIVFMLMFYIVFSY